MTSKIKKGFSLIELMIVIAIIGILAAIAIPAYNDYIGRAKASELISSTSALQDSITEYRVVTGTFASAKSDDIEDTYGVSNPADEAQYVSSIAVVASDDDNADLVITGSSAVDDLELTLSAEWTGNSVSWTCSVTDGPVKFAPASCRTSSSE